MTVSIWLHLSLSQLSLWIRVNEVLHTGKDHFTLNYSLIEKGNYGDVTFLGNICIKQGYVDRVAHL